jgi:hypothetical protein
MGGGAKYSVPGQFNTREYSDGTALSREVVFFTFGGKRRFNCATRFGMCDPDGGITFYYAESF